MRHGPQGAKPQWLPYIGADDVEATVAAAERLGGNVKRARARHPDQSDASRS